MELARMLGFVAAAFLAAGALPAQADYYLAGDFNGWNAAGTLMTDLGGGTWQTGLSNVGGRHEFRVTIGDWSQNWPYSGNSWFFGDGAGNITVTFDSNTYADGWRGDWGRIGLSVDPGAWTAIGDWQGWNNASPATAMVPVGGGIYRYQQNLAPSWYQWKAVVTGSWDAIGDDFRGVNANTTWFQTTAANPTAIFEVNALSGAVRAQVTPEPATLALVGLGVAGLVARRKRK